MGNSGKQRALILATFFGLCTAYAAGRDAGSDGGRSRDGGEALGTGTPRSATGTFKWDVPNIVSEVDMPGLTWSMGVPVKMHAVTVKGKMEDTMRYMYDSFVRQGLFVDPKFLKGPLLTGVDPDTMMTYSALFQQNAPGYVTVVLGEANVLKAKPPEGAEFVPLFPGAKGVVRSTFEGVETLIYMAPGTSEEKVRAFYQDIMPKSGYQADPSQPLVFGKDGKEVSIRLQAKDGQVSVYATRRGGRVQVR